MANTLPMAVYTEPSSPFTGPVSWQVAAAAASAPCSGRKPSIPSSKWEEHKERILELYLDEDLKLSQVAQTMKDECAFDATEQMYKKKFALWMVSKYNKCSENQKRYLIRRVLWREIVEGKATAFKHKDRGKLDSAESRNIERALQRRVNAYGSNALDDELDQIIDAFIRIRLNRDYGVVRHSSTCSSQGGPPSRNPSSASNGGRPSYAPTCLLTRVGSCASSRSYSVYTPDGSNSRNVSIRISEGAKLRRGRRQAQADAYGEAGDTTAAAAAVRKGPSPPYPVNDDQLHSPIPPSPQSVHQLSLTEPSTPFTPAPNLSDDGEQIVSSPLQPPSYVSSDFLPVIQHECGIESLLSYYFPTSRLIAFIHRREDETSGRTWADVVVYCDDCEAPENTVRKDIRMFDGDGDKQGLIRLVLMGVYILAKQAEAHVCLPSHEANVRRRLEREGKGNNAQPLESSSHSSICNSDDSVIQQGVEETTGMFVAPAVINPLLPLSSSSRRPTMHKPTLSSSSTATVSQFGGGSTADGTTDTTPATTMPFPTPELVHSCWAPGEGETNENNRFSWQPVMDVRETYVGTPTITTLSEEVSRALKRSVGVEIHGQKRPGTASSDRSERAVRRQKKVERFESVNV